MGDFVSVTIVKSIEKNVVVGEVRALLNNSGISISNIDSFDESKYITYLFIQNPQRGWISITWPRHFTEGDRIAKALSKNLDTRVSSMGIYDGDYWYHNAYNNGQLLDSFVSIPEYWAETNEERGQILKGSNGDPSKLSVHYDVSESAIAPYLKHSLKTTGKANSEDRFNLSNPWVFTDFLNSVGVNYSLEGLKTSVIFEFSD